MKRKTIIKIAFLLLVIFIFWLGYFSTDVFLMNKSESGAVKNFTVKAGSDAGQVAESLSQAKLIGSKFNFELYLWLLRRGNQIKPGDYELKADMSLRELVNILTYGWGTNEKRVTIPEGWSNKQISDYLVKNLFSYLGQNGSPANYLKDWNQAAARDYDYDFLASKPDTVDLEGYLFPDTYNFYTDAEPQEVVQRLLFNFDQKLSQELRDEILQKKLTVHQVVTLASIVEKEVNKDVDRHLVSDIFWRRLEVGMPLQADSTVNYATGKSLVSVSAKDKEISSPYNTYKYPGLPPGPIDNPGLEAIKAAIEPKANDYWYFLTTPAGEVIYSKTLAEHNQAKAKYLK